MNEKNQNPKAEKKNKPKGRLLFFFFVFAACSLIIFFALYGFIMPDRFYSENENRMLQQNPVLTLQGLADGSFMDNFEAYLTDQFPLRDEAIYVKSLIERILGKKEENGAYIGSDGFIFDRQTPYNEEGMRELAEAINAFKKENPQLNTVFALSPNSSCIYSEKLPEYLETENQAQQIESFYALLDKDIIKTDITEALMEAKKENPVFYKTDHHWTTRGAFSAFEKLQEPLGFEMKAEDYEFYNVTNRFKGTLSAKVTSVSSEDSLEVCIPKGSEGSFFIDFYGEKEKSASFLYKEKLRDKNKYEVFLGGNYAMLSVTTALENDRKLVVIKDSFANCLLPMLTPYFSKILVLDPRYMTESVSTILQEDKYTDLLFLYNANTLFEDSSLKVVLG